MVNDFVVLLAVVTQVSSFFSGGVPTTEKNTGELEVTHLSFDTICLVHHVDMLIAHVHSMDSRHREGRLCVYVTIILNIVQVHFFF